MGLLLYYLYYYNLVTIVHILDYLLNLKSDKNFLYLLSALYHYSPYQPHVVITISLLYKLWETLSVFKNNLLLNVIFSDIDIISFIL